MQQNDVINFLIRNGQALLLFTETNNIEEALMSIMGDSKMRERVSNFYQINDFAEMWRIYHLSDNGTKKMIEREIQNSITL